MSPQRISAGAILTTLLAACAAMQPAEMEPLDVAGVQDGSFDVDGQTISGTLELQ